MHKNIPNSHTGQVERVLQKHYRQLKQNLLKRLLESYQQVMKDKTDCGVAPLFKKDKFLFRTKKKYGILRETFF